MSEKEQKSWRLDNAQLTLKVADLEKRILNLEERIGKIEKSRRRKS